MDRSIAIRTNVVIERPIIETEKVRDTRTNSKLEYDDERRESDNGDISAICKVVY